MYYRDEESKTTKHLVRLQDLDQKDTNIMNISVGNESLEYLSIEMLSKCKAGVIIEVSVFVSSFIIHHNDHNYSNSEVDICPVYCLFFVKPCPQIFNP